MSVIRSAMRVISRWLYSLSAIGIVLGTLFFAAALTPTLIPRSALTQGILAGGCFAIGYGCGVFGRWLWHYLELPAFRPRIRLTINGLLAVTSLVTVISFLWRATEWQNSIRFVMSMAPVESARPFRICAIALVTFGVLLTVARLFKLIVHFLSGRIQRFIPRKIANVIGVTLGHRLIKAHPNSN